MATWHIYKSPTGSILRSAIAIRGQELAYLEEGNEKVRRTILLLATTALAVLLSSGVALALNTINCKDSGRCVGTDRADLMKGTSGFNEMYGRDNDDTLKAFGRSDALIGQEGDDRLLAGRGGDFVLGGRGDDTLRGEEGLDFYIFERSNWGEDTITEDSPSRHFLALPIAENLTGPVTTNLNSDSGPTPEVTNAQSASTVNWEGNVITFVFGSSGDDTVTGNDAANEIYDDAGPAFYGTPPDTDAISAGGGNDFIVVQDGDSDDTVNCGAGDDTVFSDETEVLIAPDCEENNPEEFEMQAIEGENAPRGELSEFRSFQVSPH
jgi:Ca2+-binding RTX toxin-like protein